SKQVQNWMNQKTKLKSAAPYIQKLHKVKSPAFPELEKELFLWVIDLRKAVKAVT
ncbi:3552_t:CDS:1, partial [Funneliformis geosporum]